MTLLAIWEIFKTLGYFLFVQATCNYGLLSNSPDLLKLVSSMIYSGDLKSNLVWILNGPIEVGSQMVLILNEI